MDFNIAATTIASWKFKKTDVELRIKPNRDFKPRGENEMFLSRNHLAFPCTYNVNTGNLVVPEVTLPTTTDSEIGQAIRYIAEFWDSKKGTRITHFPVSNFLLSPDMRDTLLDDDVTWEEVSAFSRNYKRANNNGGLGGLNIDLSDYYKKNEVQALILAIINADFTGVVYTKSEIDSLLAIFQDAFDEALEDVPSKDDYYTRTQVDTVIGTTISNFFNNPNPNQAVYNKTQINNLISSFITAAALDGYYTAEETDDEIDDLRTEIEGELATSYYTRQQVTTVFTNLLTTYYTEIETNQAIATALANYYTKQQIDDKLAAVSGSKLQPQTIQFTTGNIAKNETHKQTVSLGLSYIVNRVEVSSSARVRIYNTAAQRDADTARPVTEKAVAGRGLVLDVNLNSQVGLALNTSPSPVGSNGDETKSVQSYLNVENKGDGATTITVKITVTRLEK